MNQREIKFRAWDKNNSQMITTLVMHTYPLCGSDLAAIDESLILMQFTGLHDKNGKEIYEGDIVRGALNNGMGKDTRWAIAWCAQKAKWQVSHHRLGAQNLGITETSARTMEVIGNIYENPELLAHSTTEI